MIKCKYCSKECKNANSLRNHERLCKMNPEYDPHKYQCKFCGKYSPTKDGNHRHEIMCDDNPQKQVYLKPWNKGLTKETSDIVKRCASKMSERISRGGAVGCFGLKGDKNYSTRVDVRSKISNKMIGNHNNNPDKSGRGKKGWYKGYFCSSTYELAFLIYCIDNNIPVKRCPYVYEYTYMGKKHKYYPDFIVNNTIVEIKGFYTEKVKLKTESVIDRPIIVLYRDDMSEIFEYIRSKYNKIVDKNLHELYDH